MSPKVSALDHLVLTVASISKTVAFYQDALGMTATEFQVADGSVRWALYFGDQKINLHQAGQEFFPNARKASAGSADLCFLTDVAIENWQTHLSDLGVEIEEGPVSRSGAISPIMSIYVRDPDGNLVEISKPSDS